MAVIKGWGQTKYIRKPSETDSLIDLFAEAISTALKDANLNLSEIDGFAVSSFTLKPDRAIDLAVKFNLSKLDYGRKHRWSFWYRHAPACSFCD